MSAPAVWEDAKARIRAVAGQHNLPVELPNEGKTDGGGLYVRAEIHSSGAAQLDLDNSVWIEEGMVAVDLMVPTGTGFDQANAIRHEFGRAFRRGIPPQGLVYLEQGSLPGEQGDDAGNWYRLTLSVSWSFQDLT
jgi:hypothetical protein